MKVRIELVDDSSEEEVIIRCRRMDDTVGKIQQYIREQTVRSLSIAFYQGNEEYYFPIDKVLFFETEGEHIYAHTERDAYRIKYRLYELEEMLPPYFMRCSKSTILNSMRVYSITKNLSASSLVGFENTHKHVYVSRKYYQQLRRMMRKDELT